MTMTISSPEFSPGEEIPRVATCEGTDRSPALRFAGVPDAAQSLVLLIDDPDAPDPAAPRTTWAHWLLYNLQPTTTELAAGVAPSALPPGAREGKNDWKQTGYRGPCPPVGRHRYFHRLFALDRMLPDLRQPDRPGLLAAIEKHIIARAELIGTYQKQRR